MLDFKGPYAQLDTPKSSRKLYDSTSIVLSILPICSTLYNLQKSLAMHYLSSEFCVTVECHVEAVESVENCVCVIIPISDLLLGKKCPAE